MSVATAQKTPHSVGERRHAEASPGTERADRDSKGRFVKGNAGGPGNPFNRQVAALRQQLVDALTPERMGRVIEAVIQRAEAGDLAAAKLLWQYGMGKPAQTVQPDRMDIEELTLYQEQQLAPEAWLQIIKSIPAEMACRMLRPVMPVLSRSAAKHLQEMARQSGIDVSKPAPLVTGDNGEEAPKANGGNGDERGVVNGAWTASRSACPRKRGHGTQTDEAPLVTGDNGQEPPVDTGDIGCAAKRRRSSVGASPTRQRSLQPVAIGAAGEVTTSPKPLVQRAAVGGLASQQAVTAVNAIEALKPRVVGADPARLRGRPLSQRPGSDPIPPAVPPG